MSTHGRISADFNPNEMSALFDPHTGSPPFRLQQITMPVESVIPQRTNYFSVYWIAKGSGQVWADSAQHPFQRNQLLFFVPYQYLRFDPDEPTETTLLQFHANFLCVETFHAETGCSGALFNDPYGVPIVDVVGPTKQEVLQILERMQREQQERQLAYDEALLASMRILLILATRLKPSRGEGRATDGSEFRDPLLEQLRELIEQHYCRLHAPSDYAALLHTTTKTLNRCVRKQLGKTLTDLIRDRILKHAKWQLLHTLRPVKEIAQELGYQDELYFGRLFKKATGYSPTFFREFETRIRNGSNLSMDSSQASIPTR